MKGGKIVEKLYTTSFFYSYIKYFPREPNSVCVGEEMIMQDGTELKGDAASYIIEYSPLRCRIGMTEKPKMHLLPFLHQSEASQIEIDALHIISLTSLRNAVQHENQMVSI